MVIGLVELGLVLHYYQFVPSKVQSTAFVLCTFEGNIKRREREEKIEQIGGKEILCSSE